MGNGFFDFKSLGDKLHGKTATVILLVVGIAGMILILLSEFIHPGQASTQTASQSSVSGTDISAYEGTTEQRLESIISNIYGVGRVKVLVTAESGVENVYEQDNKTTTDKTQQNGGDGSVQTQDNENTEQNPTVVNNDSGGQQALVKLQRQPQILGVVVVCDGGGNPDVEENIVDTVSTALGLPTNKISVSRMEAQKQ